MVRVDQLHHFCPHCNNFGFCSKECTTAPWNADKPLATPWVYLLRKRRWTGMPLERVPGDKQ